MLNCRVRRQRQLAASMERINGGDPLASEWMKIERLEPQTEAQRIAGPIADHVSELEVVMHFDAQADYEWEEQFLEYAVDAGIELDQDLQYQSRGLWFLAARGNDAAAKRLARFSFVRSVRPMPKIIEAPHMLRMTRGTISVTLPTENALDPDCRIAVFDGGPPAGHPFGQWARAIEPGIQDRIGGPVATLEHHGMAVTSALLFGHVVAGQLPRPYCTVDHYRALGSSVADRQMYATLLYVDKVLSSMPIRTKPRAGRGSADTSPYEFANLSIGPSEIIGDDKVTAWTAMLDDHCQQHELLIVIAVGNDGKLAYPENRIQVPSDCVNALAIGATSSDEEDWNRAPYSSIGPGRAPGIVKPDLVQFGGDVGSPFNFLFPGPSMASGSGTSYAAPMLLRTAAALRAHFGRAFAPC
jgi:hypothetical protein